MTDGLDYWGDPVTPHVELHSEPEPSWPWRPAGWYAAFWTAGGLPILRGPHRDRAEAQVALDAALAEVAADLVKYAAAGWLPRGVTPPQRTRTEIAAAALAALERQRAEYAALLADPNVKPSDLPRDPDRWRYRDPPNTLTFREDDRVLAPDGTVEQQGGWFATWTYACINKRKRRTDVGPFTSEQDVRAYAANRWRGRRINDDATALPRAL